MRFGSSTNRNLWSQKRRLPIAYDLKAIIPPRLRRGWVQRGKSLISILWILTLRVISISMWHSQPAARHWLTKLVCASYVIIICPSSSYLTTTLPEGAMQGIHRADDLQDYQDIFVKVGEWGKFERSDIERNNILDAQDNGIGAPTFVRTFEGMLERKPRVRSFVGLPVCCSILMSQCSWTMRHSPSFALDHTLNPSTPQPMRKRAIPTKRSCGTPHTSRLSHLKTFGKRMGPLNIH